MVVTPYLLYIRFIIWGILYFSWSLLFSFLLCLFLFLSLGWDPYLIIFCDYFIVFCVCTYVVSISSILRRSLLFLPFFSPTSDASVSSFLLFIPACMTLPSSAAAAADDDDDYVYLVRLPRLCFYRHIPIYTPYTPQPLSNPIRLLLPHPTLPPYHPPLRLPIRRIPRFPSFIRLATRYPPPLHPPHPAVSSPPACCVIASHPSRPPTFRVPRRAPISPFPFLFPCPRVWSGVGFNLGPLRSGVVQVRLCMAFSRYGY